ncbi:hypothetical protein [Caloramator sp. Dgby_cultured_2]|uniref:hypothetical protein n=1 Tax=Caloramator sp. Dgby_cultured_2 TaxID=3029174 RepID=UPI00237D7B77|nr:hypothetical protein [Caloramator sp. Dgby_cultured_2]WDU82292.1 hypothetical protein PWK10_11365 [Caloramator sp. Dgby_cultured_2]
MKIGEIIKDKQPDVYRKLNKHEKKERKQEHLSFYDIQELMQGGIHVYKRHRGAFRQIK